MAKKDISIFQNLQHFLYNWGHGKICQANWELPAPTSGRFHRFHSTVTKPLTGGPEDNLKLESGQGAAVTILVETLLISRKLLFRIGVWQDSPGTVLRYSLPQGRSEEGELFKLNTWPGWGQVEELPCSIPRLNTKFCYLRTILSHLNSL